MTEYYSGNGVIQIITEDNQVVDLGNCTNFQIYGNGKFKLVLEDFSIDKLAIQFGSEILDFNLQGSGENTLYKCIKPKLDSTKRYKIRFLGINSARSNRKVLFEAAVKFNTYQSIRLISDSIEHIVLYGHYNTEDAIFGFAEASDSLSTFKNTVVSSNLKMRRDLSKVNDSLFVISSSNTIINIQNVNYLEPVDNFSCRVVLVGGKVFEIKEPIKQVIKFFERFRYNYAKDIYASLDSIAKDFNDYLEDI